MGIDRGISVGGFQADPPSVSAVIPTHNRPLLLARAVDSVRRQTEPAHEVVIVDDGSLPPVNVAELDSKNLRVLVHRNEVPKGPAAARNQGVRLASGNFIGFLDDDDYWLPDKIAAARSCIARHRGVDVFINRSAWTATAQRSIEACAEVADPKRLALLQQAPHLSGVVVRRSLHLEVGFDESFPAAADLDYLLRLFERGRVFVLPDVLAIHSRPDDEASAVTMERRIAGRLAYRAKHAHYFQDPEVEAFFLARLAHQYRRAGLRWRAFAVSVKSVVTRPTALGLKSMLVSLLPSVVIRQK